MTPTEVRNDAPEKRVLVTWDDGRKDAIAWSLLRGYCPCAHCQGHGAGPKKFIESKADLELKSIKPVGHYALQLGFSDGHSTGLYTFEYLRELGSS
jgi:DUF971 family protein